MINPKSLLRGSLWWVDLNPTTGHEQAKKRPCLIISATSYNQGRAGLVTVLPVTSRHRDVYWHVPLAASESGLEKQSSIICDQPRSVSLQRFTPEFLGFVSDQTMAQVEERLRMLLYLMPSE